jgi:hypothetical protein
LSFWKNSLNSFWTIMHPKWSLEVQILLSLAWKEV